jgi:hypothetical protein
MIYLYFYLVTRFLTFLLVTLYLRTTNLSTENRETITSFFMFSLIPFATEVFVLITLPILFLIDFFKNYFSDFCYKVLNGRPRAN